EDLSFYESTLTQDDITDTQEAIRLDATTKNRQETDEKITKASKGWAQLISRIYEVDPLTCANCGKK
ncbi:MAG: hypothetical protein LLF94_01480, partial [Chlamydiales bacterium]|nr:hypothetical protein [Chlamydiales bacterium]